MPELTAKRMVTARSMLRRTKTYRSGSRTQSRREQYRLILSNSTKALGNLEPSLPKDLSDLEEDALLAICRHCVKFIDTTATFLTQIVGRKVSLSVKFLWMTSEVTQPVLHTLFRSTNTRWRREVYKPRNDHSYRENTAFKELLERWPYKKEFVSDDLLMAHERGEYDNSNPRWYCFYTSTAVIPIPCSDDDSNFPIGFVCADCMGGELDNEEIKEILRLCSKHLYNVLGALFSQHIAADQGTGVAPKDLALRPASPFRLPCGWKYAEDQLSSTDVRSQAVFQGILEKIDGVYQRHPDFTEEAPGASPGVSASGLRSPHFEDQAMGRDENKFADYTAVLRRQAEGSQNPSVKQWVAVRDAAGLSAEDAETILKRMAEYNPDAAEILRRKKVS